VDLDAVLNVPKATPGAGLVTLVGLVSKNGILMVEFANKRQEAGDAKRDEVVSAAMTRLRPVLMTSVATVAGHFPLTLVTGAGAAARNSIGLVLVGGMTIGTLFTHRRPLHLGSSPATTPRTANARRGWRRRSEPGLTTEGTKGVRAPRRSHAPVRRCPNPTPNA